MLLIFLIIKLHFLKYLQAFILKSIYYFTLFHKEEFQLNSNKDYMHKVEGNH